MKTNQGSNVRTYDVGIIGAGFAGIGAGIRLKMEGYQSFIIFEKANEIGGTWRDNTYPGCACDIPSLLYSFSFEPNPNWSRSFSRQAEILDYLKYCAKKRDINRHICFNTEIKKVEFNKEAGRWKVTSQNGKTFTARLLISAAGPFNEAFIPNIKGKDDFEGEAFHSLHWNHDYDLEGKKVAVIGTGASAIQFVPEIAPKVKQLTVFQRTAPYITTKPDQEFTDTARDRFRRFPWYQRFWREFIYWFLEHQGRAQYANNSIRAKRKKEALDHLKNQISDPELRQKLTPDYEFGCKRVLISDEYYPTLERDNVELINESVYEILPNAVRTKLGVTRQVDTIIYGTGFYTTEFPNLYQLIGLSGHNLFDLFNQEGPEAYYGMTVKDYPNFFFMVGPNTGLGHNSIIHMMESQITYMLDYLRLLKETDNDRSYFNLKSEVQQTFNEEIQKRLATMVWSDGGCSSYYLKNQDGKNTSIWPGSTVAYRKRTKKVNINDYEIVKPLRKIESEVTLQEN